jgi:signal transduction histidine kinase
VRRRIALLSLAVTSLVVISFLIPLALLVRNQAENRALSRAERFAESIAAALAVATSPEDETISKDLAEEVIDAFGTPEGISIIFTDGDVRGARVEMNDNIERAREGSAFTTRTQGGAEVLVPVLSADAPAELRTVVVRNFVPEAELTSGVTTAWVMLAGLGVFLIVVAVLAADGLGRSIVRPVAELSIAARALGAGDLDTRVKPAGPDEIEETGVAFNFLAQRLGTLLSAERESVADLSHRLRTPLAALRLQAEALGDVEESAALLEEIDNLGRAVDRLIEEARRPSRDEGERTADLSAVVRHRASFWKVLADEQGRMTEVRDQGVPLPVRIADEELGAVVDTLIENVFAHTPPGSGYTITVGRGSNGAAVLVVEDEGGGFPGGDVLERGASAGGSTGLGLDIVRRAAERSGGGLRIENVPGGGARVAAVFGS